MAELRIFNFQIKIISDVFRIMQRILKDENIDPKDREDIFIAVLTVELISNQPLIPNNLGRRMEELIILEDQATLIKKSIDYAVKLFQSNNRISCFDRDLMQASQYIENCLNKEPNKTVSRFR